MMTLSNSALILASTSGASALALVASEKFQFRRGVWIFKPLASALFVATGLASGGMATPSGQWIVAGLILGAAGDVLLIPHSKTTFLLGLGLFLLGHLAYVGTCLTHGTDYATIVGASVILAIVAYLISRWLLPHVEAEMKGPVIAYMLVISAMVAAAAGVATQSGDPTWVLAAIAFFVSDISVARDRFVAPGFFNRAWGLPLYYAAQITFALTAAR